MACRQTPSQTVGPFFSIGLDTLNRSDLTSGVASGERVTISGRVLDGDGCAVPDAVLEIWQADSQGNFPDQNSGDSVNPFTSADFFGFGRIPTNAQGEFTFTTLKPGAVNDRAGQIDAPHLAVSIFMRGLLQRLVTRMYFPDESLNESDRVLALAPAERRHTLVARRRPGDRNSLEWNICLQGGEETVFFEC